MRKKFFAQREMKHREMFPSEVVDPSSVETLKAGLDRALRNLIWLMSLLIAGRLSWMKFKSPFQPKLFYDSIKYSKILQNHRMNDAGKDL